MTTYWALFLLSILPEQRSEALNRLFWFVVFVVMVVVIGFRFEVGCDWGGYFRMYMQSEGNLARALLIADPGYGLINWLGGYLGGGYHFVNAVCALFFVSGLLVFVRHQPLPSLALAIAIPYMTVVVAMGYTRQAVALGFLMVALTRLGYGRNISFYVLVLIGALFHKTVVVLLPLGVLGLARGRGITNWLAFGLALWWGSFLVLESYERLWVNYVDAQMQSQGATIRVAMNVFPAVAFLIFKKRWDEKYDDGYLWQWIAWASILCVPLLQIATTAVDRMALYFLPLQVIVFSRLPLLFDEKQQALIGRLIILGYASVLFVWLNYAVHAKCWVPYGNALGPVINKLFTSPAISP